MGCGSGARPPAVDGSHLDTAVDASDLRGAEPSPDGGAADGGQADGPPDILPTPEPIDAAIGEPGDAGADEPLPPGAVTGTIVNGSSEFFRLPDGIRFRVSIEGAAATSTMAMRRDDAFVFTLPDVPAGARTVVLEELDDQGGASWDLFSATSRRRPIEVTAGAAVTADFELRWHWRTSPVPSTQGVRTSSGWKQVLFDGPAHGFAVFRQDPGLGGIAEKHIAVLETSDGGTSWSLASARMIAGDGEPWTGNWFGGRPLLSLPGQGILISLFADGSIVRSADAGKTWAALAWRPPVWGPGNIFHGGIVRSGDRLYLAAHTGGVQSSSDRDSIARSLDGGLGWETIVDRCDRNEASDPCSNARQPALPVRFAGNDFGCGPAGHCISVGARAALVTTDHFATTSSFPLVPDGTCGLETTAARVYWIGSSMTAWVVGPEHVCNNPRPLRRLTSDGGATWSAWEPSPVSPGGDLQFADDLTAFALEANSVSITRDGGKTFRWTGAPPHPVKAAAPRRLVVIGPHAYVIGEDPYASGTEKPAWLARWEP